VSDLLLRDCSTEGDLATIAQAVLNETAIIRDDLLNKIKALDIKPANTSLDELIAKYNKVLSPLDPSAISKQIGIPTDTPTQEEEEERLEPFGLVLVKGIIYAKGKNGNIDALRKLFFAVGSDVTQFLSLLHSTQDLILVQTRIILRKLPQTQATWTVDQARDLYQNHAIEDVYRASDNSYYVITPQFLSIDKSAKQTALELNIPENEIVTQVFWLRAVNQKSSTINNLKKLGIGPDEITAILTDTASKEIRPSSVETLRAQSDKAVNRAVSQMNLLNSRFPTADSPTKEALRKEIITSVDIGRGILLSLEAKVRFIPTLIVRPEDIDDFLKLNSQEDLSYLFANRRSIGSIDFQVTQDKLISLIKSASNVPAGSSTVSSVLANKNVVSLDSDIASTNQSWTLNECARLGMTKTGDLKWLDLLISYQCLTSMQVRPPAASPVAATPVQGYDSFDSPSSIMTRRADLALTLNMPDLFDAVNRAVKPLSDALKNAIGILVSMLKNLQKAMDDILKPLIAKVKDTVAKIQAFISKHASFFGTASLNSSILKCALGFGLQPSLPFLEDIAPLLEALSAILKDLVSAIASIVGEFLAKVICIPMNYLNSFLKGLENQLPLVCKINSFQLPADLQAALIALREGFTAQNFVYTNASRDMFRLQASISALPGLVTAFSKDLACNQTPTNDRFMSTFEADVGSSDLGLPNPISGASNPLAALQTANPLAGVPTNLTQPAQSLIPVRG
jgi:hypothetical protein